MSTPSLQRQIRRGTLLMLALVALLGIAAPWQMQSAGYDQGGCWLYFPQAKFHTFNFRR